MVTNAALYPVHAFFVMYVFPKSSYIIGSLRIPSLIPLPRPHSGRRSFSEPEPTLAASSNLQPRFIAFRLRSYVAQTLWWTPHASTEYFTILTVFLPSLHAM
jgi:hypothetical protein